MRANRSRAWMLCGALGLLAAATGCQVDVGGQTLPSPYYMGDDVQYFPAGPEFLLSREAAALRAARDEAFLPPETVPAPAELPPR